MADVLIVDCSTGRAVTRPQTQAEISQAQSDAQAAAVAAQAAALIATNTTAIQTKLVAVLSNNQAWLTNNPNGALLTAAQTKVLVQELNGIIRLVLGLLLDVTQLQSIAGT